jgi:hypothetical protein
MADYRPAAIFGPRAAIGRGQFLMSFAYEAAVLTGSGWLAAAAGPAAGAVMLVGAVIAYAMMTLAIKARLADGGMTPRWLALPFAYLATDMVRSATGTPVAFDFASSSLLSVGGVVLLVKTAMVALLLLLLLVPSLPRAVASPA